VNIDRPDGQTCPQPDRSSVSEPINLHLDIVNELADGQFGE
jgi:hypothetical protein